MLQAMATINLAHVRHMKLKQEAKGQMDGQTAGGKAGRTEGSPRFHALGGLREGFRE